MSEDQLVDLEIRLTYQEETLQTLNDVVYRQQKQIDQLVVHIERLHERLSALGAGESQAMPTMEIPPHY